MMTLDAQNENVLDMSTPTIINCNEKHYDFCAGEMSKHYRGYLLECLCNDDGVVIPEVEYDDSQRYSKENRGNLIAPRTVKTTSSQPVRDYKPQQKTVRTFDRKKTSILVMYMVMVAVVVIALVLTVPGTAWERDDIPQSIGTSQVAMAAESKPVNDSLNVMLTENGPVAMELTPYEKQENTHTNWFDKLCDWVSSAVGG